MSLLKSKGGYSLFEMLMVLCLLGLFALGALSLINVGADAFNSIAEKREEGGNVRLAMSYLSTRLRQNDSGAVSVMDIDGGKALVISESYDGLVYNTIIYHSEGALYEVFQDASLPFNGAAGDRITFLEELYINEADGRLIEISARDGSQSLSTSVKIRSG